VAKKSKLLFFFLMKQHYHYVLQMFCSAAARKLNYFAEQIKILPGSLRKEEGSKFSCRTYPKSLKRGERGQNLQRFSCRTHQILLGSLGKEKKARNFLADNRTTLITCGKCFPTLITCGKCFPTLTHLYPAGTTYNLREVLLDTL